MDIEEAAQAYVNDTREYARANPVFERGMLCDFRFADNTKPLIVKIIGAHWDDYQYWLYDIEVVTKQGIECYRVNSCNLKRHIGGSLCLVK